MHAMNRFFVPLVFFRTQSKILIYRKHSTQHISNDIWIIYRFRSQSYCEHTKIPVRTKNFTSTERFNRLRWIEIMFGKVDKYLHGSEINFVFVCIHRIQYPDQHLFNYNNSPPSISLIFFFHIFHMQKLQIERVHGMISNFPFFLIVVLVDFNGFFLAIHTLT